MSKLTEIKAKIAELQREADETFKLEKLAAIADITSKIFAYNISIDEFQKRGRSARTATTPRKYRKSEYVYWGGRGPKPKWVKEVEEKGENLEAYRVPDQITQ